MEMKPILVVDDEKNICMTMSQSLEPLGVAVQTAVNGEEALRKIHDSLFGIVFLDLKMPGMDGMEVLRRIKENRPKTRVIIITAHGTIASAVEAMKLGAVDFIQKPFSPAEIRELALKVFEREALDNENATDYSSLLELAKRHIADYNPAAARELVKKAIAADPGKPDAYNLLGALLEINAEILEALKFYRAALDIDPTYQPARQNLERATSWKTFGSIHLGAEKQDTQAGDEEKRGE